MRYFNFVEKIYCVHVTYWKHLQISNWDCSAIGFCKAFYCEESLHLYWWGNFKQHIIEAMSVNIFDCIQKNLYFNNNDKTIERGKDCHDRLYRIQPVYEPLC
jgi:hypothetical protein